jgi:hypothetical protein
VTAKKHTQASLFWTLLEGLKKLIDLNASGLELDNPTNRHLALALSHSIFPGNVLDDAIALAFARTGLDARNPVHWKLLLGLFCAAHFGARSKLAAPKVWTPERLAKLYKDVDEVRSRRARLSDVAVARILKKNEPYSETYGQFTIDYIRERIGDAKSSRREFEETLKTYLASLRALRASFDLEWTSEIEAKYASSFIETGCKAASVFPGNNPSAK